MNEYKVRSFEAGDEEDIVSLLEQVFDGWPKSDLIYSSLDYWKWKFQDNPMKRGHVCSVALKEGDIVGCMHDFQIICKLGKKEVFVGQGCDLAVHPEHRRQGLYNNMLKILDKSRRENNISMTISVTGNPVVSERSKRRGFPRLQSAALFLVKVKNIDLHLKHRPLDNPWVIKVGVNLLKMFQRNPKKRNDVVSDVKLKPVTRFGDEAEEYYNKIKSHYNFISIKSPKYLNWRFCDKHGGNYLVTGAFNENALVGYIVTKVNRIDPEYHEGYILELQCLPGRIDVARTLLMNSMDYFDSENLNIVYAWVLKNQSLLQIFIDEGFLNSRREQEVFVRPIKPGLNLDPVMSSNINTVEYNFAYTDCI